MAARLPGHARLPFSRTGLLPARRAPAATRVGSYIEPLKMKQHCCEMYLFVNNGHRPPLPAAITLNKLDFMKTKNMGARNRFPEFQKNR
nr:hypothetical protein [uncultured Gellertiella sp.]